MCPLIRVWLLLLVLTRYTVQNGQKFLDSLAELKIPIMARYEIMTRYEQRRANPSSWMTQHQIWQGYDPSPTGQLPRGLVPCDVLKTVSFPRECLNRFISIALLNTARNRETCGLLLGKDKGGRYVVTTLLIPKQHATRDTCTIDAEELVMQFTEKRSLITLGWV
jgi:hypothetical protein